MKFVVYAVLAAVFTGATAFGIADAYLSVNLVTTVNHIPAILTYPFNVGLAAFSGVLAIAFALAALTSPGPA